MCKGVVFRKYLKKIRSDMNGIEPYFLRKPYGVIMHLTSRIAKMHVFYI